MSQSLSKRVLITLAATSLGVTVTACGGGDQAATNAKCDDNGENCTVTVGILHSLTGTMAISEKTLVDTEKMAIDEINAAGGVEVDGKSYTIETIVEDGASTWPTFAEKSKKLIDQDKVPVVFGGTAPHNRAKNRSQTCGHLETTARFLSPYLSIDAQNLYVPHHRHLA